MSVSLSDVPLGELLQLKQEIGSKRFTEVLSGNQKKKSEQNATTTHKRENKNRPREMSSRRAVGRHRDVVEREKCMVRDPRFDDLSGKYHEHVFTKTYSFINDLQESEKKAIEKQIKKNKKKGESDKCEDLKKLLNKIKQKEELEEKKLIQKQISNEMREAEQQLVGEGKKPFYMKKSERKKLELAAKFKQLEKEGRVDTFLRKKRKKMASKEKRKLPKEKKHKT